MIIKNSIPGIIVTRQDSLDDTHATQTNNAPMLIIQDRIDKYHIICQKIGSCGSKICIGFSFMAVIESM
jgi:hypothetical protein